MIFYTKKCFRFSTMALFALFFAGASRQMTSALGTSSSTASDLQTVPTIENLGERRTWLRSERRLEKCDQCNSCKCDNNCDCIDGGGGDNKCDQCNHCLCDDNCDCIDGGGNGGDNKCHQCNFCSCDANCDCIGGGGNGGASNKCDQCNSCKCDSNCDCIDGGDSASNKCDQCNHCLCDANCDCIAKSPIWGCEGDGGACQCGTSGDGTAITLNRFWGEPTDEKVWGCGGAFQLSGASLGGQWGGTKDSLAVSVGIDFSQEASYDGWEGCCYICGANLQLAGKLTSGWYCEKDFFSTGIWLKKN